MQKDKPITDESVKAGLQIEGGHRDTSAKKSNDTEEDADDMVHQQRAVFPADNMEQDLDEVVHEQAGGITTAKEMEDRETEEEDMDELVHRNSGKQG